LPQLNNPELDFAMQFNGVKMISMEKTGAENLMGDEVLERNKNLNRGFRKLRAPVKCAPDKQKD